MRFLTLADELPYASCVATIGFFDGVHRGHQFLIHQVMRCAAERGLASLLVTFRRHPRQVMQAAYQPQLLSTFEEKCSLLSATGADCCATLDFSRELAAMSARQFMEEVLKDRLSVRVLVIGYDHRFGHDRTAGFADYVNYGRELGMEVLHAEPFSLGGVNVSSSVVRACLREGEAGMATRCLGRPYALSGVVVNGFHEGHGLGYPTANLQPDDACKLVPKGGVYAVWASGHMDERRQRGLGMLNIGTRPTLDNGDVQSIEVHLLDFQGDLYGRRLTLEFVSRLRDERKFRNKAELTHQLRMDEQAVRELLSEH